MEEQNNVEQNISNEEQNNVEQNISNEEQNNVEQNNIQKSKKKNPIGIILLIIAIICFFIGGFFITKSGALVKKNEVKKEDKKDVPTNEEKEEETDENTNKDTKEEKNTNKEEINFKTSELIDSLFITDPSRKNWCSPIENLISDKKFEAKDITSTYAWDLAMKAGIGKLETISLDDVNKAVQKYLGKDYKFDPKTANTSACSGTLIYDENTKTYTRKKVDGGCGESCGAFTRYKVINETESNGIIKINIKVIFADGEKYYSDYQKNNVLGIVKEIGYDNIDSWLNDNIDKGSTYQFTFKSEDGNNVFVSSEPV